MDKIVTIETIPLTVEDKSILRKNTLISVIIVTVIETIAYLMMFHFIDTKDMEIIRICFFCFFLLVGLIIIFINLSSYLDNKKIISTGYVTNKRSHTSYSRGSNSSSRTDYYITLGEKEMSVMINHYDQVHTGDKICMHQTKWNKSIFRIDVLESAGRDPKATMATLTPREINTLDLSIRESFMDKEERAVVRRKLYSLLLWRTLLWAGVCYVLYFVLFIVAIVLLPTQVLTNHRYVFIGAFATIPALLYISVNRKTFKVFLDMSQGKKRCMAKIVTDIVQNNKPMYGKHTIITSGSPGVYYYVTTHDKRFLQIDSELAQKISCGDKIVIHEALNSKLILNATEAIQTMPKL